MTPVTPRTAAGRALVAAHRAFGVPESEVGGFRDTILAIEAESADALLAALRALVEDTVLGRPPTQWCNVCEVSNGHTMDCSAGAGVVLLRDLSPKEEGQ